MITLALPQSIFGVHVPLAFEGWTRKRLLSPMKSRYQLASFKLQLPGLKAGALGENQPLFFIRFFIHLVGIK